MKMSKMLRAFAVMIMIVSVMQTAVSAAPAAETAVATASETAAEVHHSGTVRVGCFPLNGFFNFSSDGKLTDGYGADYTERVFEYTDLDYEYVVYSSWVEALEALSAGEIDMLAPSQRTLERESLYRFDSFPIGTEYGALLALDTNDKLTYEDYPDFDGLEVGVVPSLIFLDEFEEYQERNGFNVNFSYYKDTAALVSALNAGEVDAALVNMMVKTDTMKLLARFGASPIYYMFSSGSGDLHETIDVAIDKLNSENPGLDSYLSGTYFKDFTYLPYTREELDYINRAGNINVALHDDSAPYSYLDSTSNTITGVDEGMLNEINKLSGLKFTPVAVPHNNMTDAWVQENEIALIPGGDTTSEALDHDNFYSTNYMTVYKYFIGKHDTEFDIEKPYKIACRKSSENQIKDYKTAYPNFEFINFDTVEECVEAVRTGKVDFFLNDRYSVSNLLVSPRNRDLVISPFEIYETEVCYKITVKGRDGELLTSILNKAINQIPDADKEKLISEYTSKNTYKYTVADFIYQYRTPIIIAVLALLTCIGVFIVTENSRKKAQKAIMDNELKLRHITNNIRGGVVVLKPNKGLNIVYANTGFLELIGCDRETLEENGSYLAYVHPEDTPKIQDVIDSDQKELSLNLRILKSDGTYVPTLFNCTTGDKADGEKELYCVIMDMTEREQLTEQLLVDKRRTELLLKCVDEVFYEVSLTDNKITTSDSFMDKYGWKLPDELPQKRQDFITKTWNTDEENIEKIRLSTAELLMKKEPVSTIVKLMSEVEKRMVWCEIVQHPVLSKHGDIISVIGLIRDVDSMIEERHRLMEKAQHDPLTGLYNKETFEHLVSEALIQLPDKNHVMVFIDLDRFKNLNDTLGHMEGDKAICDAADKLRVIFSNYDILARFGGDEFCIFVKDIPTATAKDKLAWMIEKLRAEYHGLKGSVKITSSCGAICTNGKLIKYDELLKRADKLLYQAKEDGRDRYVFDEC